MIPVLVSLIAFYLGYILCYVLDEKKPKSKTNTEKPYGYKIHIGRHWWNVNLLIEKRLPKLPDHLYRWEIYTIENAGRVKIVLNVLDMNTDKATCVASKDITYHYADKPWSHLKGCSYEYMEQEIMSDCINPIISKANAAASKLAGWEVERTNYKVL